MSLDLSKLEKLKRQGDNWRARCPACAASGADTTGNHLRIDHEGRFGCAIAPADPEHRRQIYALVGAALDQSTTHLSSPIRICRSTLTPEATRLQLPRITDAADFVWREGVEYLQSNAQLVKSLASWRGYHPDTIRTLAEDGSIGCPITRGNQRGVAFPVEAPERCDLGMVQSYRVGYHVRHKPKEDERAAWTYHPSDRDGQATPGLPFVLGAGSAASARIVVIVEGQWDAIALADAAGWLASDAAWPEDLTLFGVRGAGGWRVALNRWSPYLSPSAEFAVIPQTDNAAQAWLQPDGLVNTLRCSGHLVRLISIPGDVKDINDLLRAGTLGRGRIDGWLAKEVAP